MCLNEKYTWINTNQKVQECVTIVNSGWVWNYI